MDIRDLKYVQQLSRYGSFTKAAEALHITQPTLSKMIKNLEEELGVVLFTREGKRIGLTDAGEVIVRQAEAILESFRSLELELNDLTELGQGTIRIGLPPMVGSTFFPRIMSHFRSQYPKIDIRLVERGSKRIEAEVGNGKLDMGVVLLPTDQTQFDCHTIVKETLCLLVHPTHPLAHQEEVKLAELANESFIFFSEDFALHNSILAQCQQAGFQPHIVCKSSQWDFIMGMVAANLGIALLPKVICQGHSQSKVRVLRLTEPTIPWHLGIVWRKRSYLSFAAREWIRVVKDLF